MGGRPIDISLLPWEQSNWKFLGRQMMDGHGGLLLWCECSCGKAGWVRPSQIRQLKKCISCSKIGKENRRTHGDGKKGSPNYPLYCVWCSMKQRCYYTKSNRYYCYGAVGIKVCSEWKNNYEQFKQWALANGYERGLSIDRIDGTKGYCPENCRWATDLQQGQNRKTTRFYTYNGETLCLSEWARKMNMPEARLRHRLDGGWDLERALFTVSRNKNKRRKKTWLIQMKLAKNSWMK